MGEIAFLVFFYTFIIFVSNTLSWCITHFYLGNTVNSKFLGKGNVFLDSTVRRKVQNLLEKPMYLLIAIFHKNQLTITLIYLLLKISRDYLFLRFFTLSFTSFF